MYPLMTIAKRFYLILVLIVLLVGCGGGGGGGGNQEVITPPVPSLKAQALTFQEPGLLRLLVDERVENPASAQGSGNISYHSSDESVAIVDGEGTVTAVGSGAASISASISEDEQYKSASAEYSVEVQALPNTVAFAEPGPFRVPVGGSLHNLAAGLGSGAIVYSSSDPKVATVDASGLVEVHALGAVTIQATQEEGRKYLSASASYVIDSSIDMNAWAGESNTLVSLSPAARGMNLYRSSEKDCDIENYQACEKGQVDVVDAQEIVDTAATLERPGHYVLQSSGQEMQVPAWPHHFLYRYRHKTVVFNNKLWMIGTYYWDSGESVWVTGGGATWQRVESNFPARRSGHSLVVHNGKLFMIGGIDGSIVETETRHNEKNDVWVTEDGINWELVRDNAEFAPRKDHQVVSHGGKLWLIGGVDFGPTDAAYFSDIWSSEDGVNWTQELEEAPFENRFNHAAITHRGRIWLLGGNGRRSSFEVWTSENGTEWELLPVPAPYAEAESVVSYLGKIWIIREGAYDDSGIWVSEDGESWESLATDNFKVETSLHSVNVFNGRLWITGGDSDGFTRVDSVWSSADGASWKMESPSHPLPRNILSGRSGMRLEVVSHKGSFWIFEAPPVYVETDDVEVGIWSSGNGFKWNKHRIEGAFDPSQRNGALISFNDKLWAFGSPVAEEEEGVGDGLWSSEDGIHWVEEVAAAALPAVASRRTLLHNNRLWLFGTATLEASGVSVEVNQVWSSTDGINWERETGMTQYSGLGDYEVASFAGKLWVVSGRDFDGAYSRNVWHSADGKEWQQVVPIPFFAGRVAHRVASYAGKLWLIGGEDRSNNQLSDVWVSENGLEWAEAEPPRYFSSRSNFGLAAKDDALWLFGSSDSFHGVRQDLWKFTEGDGWRAGYTREFTAQH